MPPIFGQGLASSAGCWFPENVSSPTPLHQCQHTSRMAGKLTINGQVLFIPGKHDWFEERYWHHSLDWQSVSRLHYAEKCLDPQGNWHNHKKSTLIKTSCCMVLRHKGLPKFCSKNCRHQTNKSSYFLQECQSNFLCKSFFYVFFF